MIDLGCSYGVLTCIVAKYLGAKEAWGIDVDGERLNTEKLCKIVTLKHGLTTGRLVLKRVVSGDT